VSIIKIQGDLVLVSLAIKAFLWNVLKIYESSAVCCFHCCCHADCFRQFYELFFL